MSTVYHGTFWSLEEVDDPDEAVFFVPSTGRSDLEAVWFTNHLEVAKYFSSYNLTDDDKSNGSMRVILKGSLDPLTAISVQSHESPWIEVSEDMDEIHVQNREELYSLMRINGYNAFVIEDNYQEFGEPGSDIAVLEDGMFNCDAVALERRDGTFTEFMDPDKARKVFIRHAANLKAEQGAKALEI